MNEATPPAELYVARSPAHGRGLFAGRGFRTGDVLGAWPLLILSREDTAAIRNTRLYHYVFFVDEDDAQQMRAGVAFGLISMCNHDASPNAAFTVNAEAEEVVLCAVRDLAPGDEVFIDYGDFVAEALR